MHVDANRTYHRWWPLQDMHMHQVVPDRCLISWNSVTHLSHRLYSSFLQKRHSPQKMRQDTTTLSPTFTPWTLEPISSTLPMISWPRMSPFFIPGCKHAEGSEELRIGDGQSSAKIYKAEAVTDTMLRFWMQQAKRAVKTYKPAIVHVEITATNGRSRDLHYRIRLQKAKRKFRPQAGGVFCDRQAAESSGMTLVVA